MIIKVLQDNTVHVRYSDGSEQTLNSTHSHKATSPIVKAVADALPYKGAMEFTEDYVAPVFVLERGEIVCGDKCFCHDADVSGETPEIQAFFNALHSCEGGKACELCQLIVLEDEEDYQATETVEEVVEEVELINGIATLKNVTKTKKVPIFDEVPIVDEAGNPVMEIDTPAVEAVEAKEAVLDEEGNVIEEAVEAVEAVAATYKQRTYQVPRMIKGKKVSQADKDKRELLLKELKI